MAVRLARESNKCGGFIKQVIMDDWAQSYGGSLGKCRTHASGLASPREGEEFLFIILFYLKARVKERQGERHREIFHPPVRSPDGCNDQGCNGHG